MPIRKCPTCHKPTVHGYRPFCSRRCLDIDLAKWLNGSFVIPGSRDEALTEDLHPERSLWEEETKKESDD